MPPILFLFPPFHALLSPSLYSSPQLRSVKGLNCKCTYNSRDLGEGCFARAKGIGRGARMRAAVLFPFSFSFLFLAGGRTYE